MLRYAEVDTVDTSSAYPNRPKGAVISGLWPSLRVKLANKIKKVARFNHAG
jgi:hypothetical protein